ncbi:protein kinase [Streptomyces sp. NPDC002659]|uniref:serine/threonine-protein kinase n=1 Tax=Streptomyces sp. NPDC002659 TaxID=3364656 RepID=UPI0036C42CC5
MYNEESTPEKSDDGRLVADRYRLLSRLGEGGMGTVWRARDEKLHREVAVKEVRAPAGLRADDIARMYSRLEREAWAAARIADRNVVTVHDVAMDDERPWIVMELIRGRSLADLLSSEGPITPQRAARIGAEVLTALRAAHAVGVEHRDVKPGNVLLADDGRVVLSDFGIAMVEGTSALTMTGEVVGSPEYLPPERALGRGSGPESDLWSLGVMLYAAVEGTSPFRQNSALSTLRAVVDAELPSPRRAGPLAPVIEGLLRKEPAERTSAEQVAVALRNIGEAVTSPVDDSTTSETTDAPTIAPGLTRQPSPHETASTTTVATPDSLTTPEPETIDVAPLEPTATAAPVAPPAASPEPSTTHLTTPVPVTTPAPVAPSVAPPVAGTDHATAPAAITPPVPSGPQRKRRAAVVWAGAAVCALLVAGLAYALVNRHNDTDTNANRTPAGGIASSQGAKNPSAAPAVRVSVTGSNTTYAGACPPPGDQAPTFTATFTVTEPSQISYRWVSKDGSVVDPHWRILSIGEAGGGTGRDTVSLTTWSKAGTLKSEIGVEIRRPFNATSNTVPFSISCGG